MTVARPVAAFFSAFIAGIMENVFGRDEHIDTKKGQCCSSHAQTACQGQDCEAENEAVHYTFLQKISAGLLYALKDVWADLAGWFLLGIFLGGLISALIPSDFLASHLGGGIGSMFVMLAAGIPIYICATASTPVAAALMMKGVSPGSALVFLLTGPATNMTSLSVITGILGKRGTVIYLLSLGGCAIMAGLLLDSFYLVFGISASATIGQGAEMLPLWFRTSGAILVLILSVGPVWKRLISSLHKKRTC